MEDKENPKKVVYLGWLRGKHCIFHGKIFYINTISYTGVAENPLNYIDIETGNYGERAEGSADIYIENLHHCIQLVH